jgi:sporulation protein YlmC with PRC-barrel domain
MKRKVIMCVLASAALAATAPLLAKPGGGGGGGNAGGHVGGGMSGGHGFGHGGVSVGTARQSGNIGTTTIGRSNRFGSAAAHGTPLTGITNGMSVFDTGGAAVGTVTNISTKGNGSIRDVQVTLADGRHASVNGLAHASPHSALNGVGITTFTGLTPGMPVNNSAGTGVGTVSGIVLNRSGAIAGIRVALNGGGTTLIPAPSLAFNGAVVTTSWMPRH